MSAKEAGKLGGTKTRNIHGSEFYREIGIKGGKKRAENIQRDGISDDMNKILADAGQKGGRTTKARYGRDFYREIANKRWNRNSTGNLKKEE